MIGVRLPATSTVALDSLGQQLAVCGYHVSVRGDAIRISPHVYNSMTDVERFFDVLTDIVGGTLGSTSDSIRSDAGLTLRLGSTSAYD